MGDHSLVQVVVEIADHLVTLIQHGSPDVVVQMGKKLSYQVRGLEITILLQIVKGHKAFHWLVPLAVLFIVDRVLSCVKDWQDKRMEIVNKIQIGHHFELLNKLFSS